MSVICLFCDKKQNSHGHGLKMVMRIQACFIELSDREDCKTMCMGLKT